MADGPSVETNVWGFVRGNYPGQVQVLGPDVMVSGPGGNNLQLFNAIVGGLSFPLLRDCADGSTLSDTNLIKPYFQRDNYVVINKQGIIRYHAANLWPIGNRLHTDEILGTVDTLVIHGLDAGGAPAHAWGMTSAPNPAHGLVTFTLANPTPGDVPARLRVLDVTGREVARLPDAVARSGLSRVFWDGRGSHGERLAPGLYLVQAELAGRQLVHRVAITR